MDLSCNYTSINCVISFAGYGRHIFCRHSPCGGGESVENYIFKYIAEAVRLDRFKRLYCLSLGQIQCSLGSGGKLSSPLLGFKLGLLTLKWVEAAVFGVAVEVAPSQGLVDLNTAVPLGLAASEAKP